MYFLFEKNFSDNSIIINCTKKVSIRGANIITSNIISEKEE